MYAVTFSNKNEEKIIRGYDMENIQEIAESFFGKDTKVVSEVPKHLSQNFFEEFFGLLAKEFVEEFDVGPIWSFNKWTDEFDVMTGITIDVAEKEVDDKVYKFYVDVEIVEESFFSDENEYSEDVLTPMAFAVIECDGEGDTTGKTLSLLNIESSIQSIKEAINFLVEEKEKM